MDIILICVMIITIPFWAPTVLAMCVMVFGLFIAACAFALAGALAFLGAIVKFFT